MKFLKDLYADLRDRKLLPLVVVLPIAILAVPMLLKQDPEVPPPPSSEAPMPEGAPTAAVLTSAPTLKDYRERLDDLREKNPFAADPSASSPGGTPPDGAIQEVSADTSTSTSSETTSFSETYDDTVSSSSTSDDSTNVIVDGGDGGGGNGDPGGTPDSGSTSQWYEFQVDVEAGPAGDTSVRNNLGELTVLPSKSNPVAVYLGIAKGGKEAVFMVSPDVVGVSGGGSCSPSPASCELLTLGEGDEEKFDYAPSGEPDTFVIEVKDIRFVPVKNPVDRAREAGSVDATAAASGARAFYGD